jgi:DNA-binding transcriptional LysR family regulator
MDRLDWNDVRYLLAAARAGSTLAASRALKVSQTTVARRIAVLEEALGVPLFQRNHTGYRPTPEAEALMADFEAVGAAMERLAFAAAAQAREASGRLRLSTNDVFANVGVAEALIEFRAQYPDIKVELIVTDRIVDLAAGEADVAIRASGRPTDAGLVARSLGRSTPTLFGSPAYFERHGRPTSREDLNDHAFVTIGGGYGAALERWLAANAPKGRVEVRASSMLALLGQVRQGLGLAFLPADRWTELAGLEPCLEAPEESLEVWLVTHERVRRAPAVRAFMDFAAAYHAKGRRLTRLA